MFTGIIEKKGTVMNNSNHDGANRLVISSPFKQLHVGESIAVNGVCLTLLPLEDTKLSFDVSPETLSRTTLGELRAGEEVNLERAMLASTRFGGHYVSGHVDAIAQIHSIKHINEFVEVELSGFDANAMLYLIPKGSITVEGVSLTINSVVNQSIKLMLVPHTLLNTTLSFLKHGQKVNIEFDYLTRIVVHQLQVAGKLNSQIPL
ncbi:riboflavin synthase [Legionella anisa]|uniref:Riboflavin synthase n=1 Tax=Legionella anisa TaxID=28082 RepID=A0AAX0WYQ4_9GAMM|nr:riboflavin synthase [Legionella anisa]AWN75684.1 riboflavin synthase [Legionella anisa]KTC72973.1 riboflavin synthase alpha chain [Legionella anisa]MBN5935880.1 riboflavin synthase [Legionella anisa]MCW8423513.1 riboflavin synthase [Legionella anisa]MCW8447033.1 riboflavin synthase [Legionella anisa]